MINIKYNILRDFDDYLIRIQDILSDKVTTNVQLYRLGKKLFGDRFKNVYTSDDNIRLSNNQCCIVNTDSSRQAGSHWVALYRYKSSINGDHYYVFDSFGRDIKTLSKYFRFRKWINVEHIRRESYKQSNCGQLSMSYLLIFDKYKTKCIGVI